MDKDIRWQQRFTNLSKVFIQLKKAVEINHPNDTEKQGVIQSFEFTFELSWKTLKDYLESQGIESKFPRDVVKDAFQNEMLAEGELWMKMLDDRNLLAHTYDEKRAEEAYQKITKQYYPAIKSLVDKLASLSD